MTLRSLLTKAHLYVASSITAAVALVACDTSTELVDHSICRDSPVYGKHLWEISDCRDGFHMREDCLIGVKDESRQTYQYRNLSNAIDYLFYSELEIRTNGEELLLILDSEVRAVPGPEQKPHWREVNAKINEYDGYYDVYFPHGLWGEAYNSKQGIGLINENAYVPTDNPFPGEEACKSSEYYWEN